jgi:hypothetical protein
VDTCSAGTHRHLDNLPGCPHPHSPYECNAFFLSYEGGKAVVFSLVFPLVFRAPVQSPVNVHLFLFTCGVRRRFLKGSKEPVAKHISQNII